MATIGTIVANLKANTGAFISPMKKAESQTRSMNKAMNSLAGVMKGALGAAAAYVSARAIVGVARSLAGAVEQTMKTIDATAKLSDRLGIATERLTGLQYAAALSGLGGEEMSKSMEYMTKALGQAAAGSGEAKRGVEMLGLDLQQLVAMSPDQAFMQIADAVQRLPNQVDRATAAYYLFGRSGVKMVNILQQGSGAIERQIAQAKSLGAVYSRLDAAKIEQANDAITRMDLAWQGVKNTLAIQVAPIVTGVAERMAAMVARATEGGERTAKGFEKAIEVVAFLADVAQGFVDLFKVVEIVVTKVQEGLVRAYIWLMKVTGGSIQSIEEMRAYADGLAEEAAAIDKSMNQSSWGAKFKAFVKDAQAAADAAAQVKSQTESIPQAAQQLSQAVDWIKKLDQAFESTRDRLRDLQGVGGTRGMINEALMAGADVDLEKVQKLWDMLDKIDAIEKQRQQQADLQQRAQQVIEATRTPMEQYEKQVDNLNDLVEAGAISWDIYSRAVRKARKDLEDASTAKDDFSGGPGQFKVIDTARLQVAGLNIGVRDRNEQQNALLREQIIRMDRTNTLLDRIVTEGGI